MKKIQNKNDLKNELINIRVNSNEKKEIITFAENNSMNLSEFVSLAIKEKMQTNKIMDSQAKLISVIETGFKQCYEPFFKRLIVVLSRLDFNVKWLIEQQDIFMQQLSIPQERENVFCTITHHPITDISEERIQKELRKKMANKKEFEDNEQE